MKQVLMEKLNLIHNSLVCHLLEKLNAGDYSCPSNELFTKSYSEVTELADKSSENRDQLYEYYQKTLSDYLTDVATKKILSKAEKELLWEFIAQWEKYTFFVYWMQKIFAYLDNFPSLALPTLLQTGLNIFKTHLLDKLNPTILKTLFDLYEEPKEEKRIELSTLKKILTIYHSICISKASIEIDKDSKELFWNGDQNILEYQKYFEEEFFKYINNLYHSLANTWILHKSCPEYVEAVFATLQKKEKKELFLFDETTRSIIEKQFNKQFVEQHARELTEKEKTGVKEMLEKKKIEELKLLFNLLKRVPSTLSHISEKMGSYIINRGTPLIKDKEILKNPIAFATALLDLKREIDGLIQFAFNNTEIFIQTRDWAFKSLVNDCPETPSHLAEFVNMMMIAGLRGKESFAEAFTNEVIDILKLLNNKGIFIEKYKQLYALRLLQKTSISQEVEELLISKLVKELEAKYTKDIVQMGVDIKDSGDLSKTFKKGNEELLGGIEMDIKVLTGGLWDEKKSSLSKLPTKIKHCYELFESFYKSCHSARKITWLDHLGNCEIQTTFLSKSYTFIVSVYQMAILDLYNSKEAYTFSELKDLTGLSDEDLNTHLYSLMNPMYGKVLLKENLKTPKCLPSEKLTLNTGFSSHHLLLNFVPKKPKETSKKVEEDKEAERLHVIMLQTWIVRIMNCHKRLTHNELSSLCIQKIENFKVEQAMIDQEIDTLIQKEYLARDENNPNVYIFIP